MKRNTVLILLLLILAPLFSMNCSRDDTAIVRIQLVNVPEGAAQSSNSVFERVFRWFVPNAWATAQWGYPQTLQIILTAPDLFDSSFILPSSQTSFTMEVPAGPDRRITVYGSTTDHGKEWGGHAELTLNPGEVKDVNVNMVPWTNLTSVGGSADVQIFWEMTGAIYNVQGYRLYRAESVAGPYEMIKEIPNPETGFASDNPSRGKTYYYKITVYTTNAEGEFSDYKSIVW